MIESKAFNEYIEVYKKLSLKKKQDLVVEEILDIFKFLNKLKQDLNLDNNVLFNKELDDLKNVDFTDDDFVEAVYVYMCSLKEYLADYIETVSKLIYKDGDLL